MMTRIRSVKSALFQHEGLFEAEQEYQFVFHWFIYVLCLRRSISLAIPSTETGCYTLRCCQFFTRA